MIDSPEEKEFRLLLILYGILVNQQTNMTALVGLTPIEETEILQKLFHSIDMTKQILDELQADLVALQITKDRRN